MKKSMLLSTIAMIVVVVVALSTATFAWFSSFQSVSATASLEIKATDAGLEIREVNELGTGWGDWTNTITMTANSLTATAPKADLEAPVYAADPGYDGAAVPTATTVQFFEAKQDATNVWVTNAEAAAGTYIYKQFQVRSTAATSKTVTLSAEIKKNGEGNITDATKQTIQSTKIVIISTVGGDTADHAKWAGTAFKYGLKNDGTTPDAGEGNKILKTAAGGTDTAKKTALTVTPNIENIEVGDTWTLTGTNPDQYITVRVWIWIDGHTADNTAKGGKVDVALTFNAA